MSLVLDPQNPGTLYAGTSGGVFQIQIHPVALSPTNLTFGDRLIHTAGPSQKVAFALSENFQGPATVQSLSVDNNTFVIENNSCTAGTVLDAQNKPSCSFEVSFQPQVAGAAQATISLADDASPDSPHIVQLTGNGVVEPGVSLDPTHLDFGEIGVGLNSSVQKVALTDDGTGPLTISKIESNSPDFTFTHNCTAPVKVNDHCEINATFNPKSSGDKTGQIVITDDTPSKSHTIPLTGKGVILCKNGILDSGEACDGSHLNNKQCSDFGFQSGTLACKQDCTDFDTSQCVTSDHQVGVAICNNNVIEKDEKCDGHNLNGSSCESLGFVSGQLSCLKEGEGKCTFDTSACVAKSESATQSRDGGGGGCAIQLNTSNSLFSPMFLFALYAFSFGLLRRRVKGWR